MGLSLATSTPACPFKTKQAAPSSASTPSKHSCGPTLSTPGEFAIPTPASSVGGARMETGFESIMHSLQAASTGRYPLSSTTTHHGNLALLTIRLYWSPVTANPSLELTPSGVALGPPPGVVHHPSSGPSATPALAAQLKRWAPDSEAPTPHDCGFISFAETYITLRPLLTGE